MNPETVNTTSNATRSTATDAALDAIKAAANTINSMTADRATPPVVGEAVHGAIRRPDGRLSYEALHRLSRLTGMRDRDLASMHAAYLTARVAGRGLRGLVPAESPMVVWHQMSRVLRVCAALEWMAEKVIQVAGAADRVPVYELGGLVDAALRGMGRWQGDGRPCSFRLLMEVSMALDARDAASSTAVAPDPAPGAATIAA